MSGIDFFHRGHDFFVFFFVTNIIITLIIICFGSQGVQGIEFKGPPGEQGDKGIKGEKGKPASVGQLDQNTTTVYKVRPYFLCCSELQDTELSLTISTAALSPMRPC